MGLKIYEIFVTSRFKFKDLIFICLVGAADAFKTRGVFGVSEIYRLSKGLLNYEKSIEK